MIRLSHSDYLAMRAHARVIEADLLGDKVLALSDGSFLKLFRRKRLLSSAAWHPYANRFADNARGLAALGICSPEPVAVYRIRSIARDAVRYRPLAGSTLRQLATAGTGPADLRYRLGRFVARLHQLGVYFRSLHLGNIVLTPAGELGLIDVADLRITRRPLHYHRRRRNMKHLLRIEADRAWLTADGTAAFRAGYAEGAGDTRIADAVVPT